MSDGVSQGSDVEFVERVRRGLTRYDRLRWPRVPFYLILAIVFVGLAVAASAFVQGGPWPGLGPGFAIGLTLGIMLGMLAVKIAYGLVNALIVEGRTERLLVRYFDTLRSLDIGQVREINRTESDVAPNPMA